MFYVDDCIMDSSYPGAEVQVYRSKMGDVNTVRVTPKLVRHIIVARKRASLEQLSRQVSAVFHYSRETVGRVARPPGAAEWSAKLF